jgi:plasmid stabilization system protein ParE
MAYEVVLADSAKTDADSIYDWATSQAPLRGPEWFEALIDCLYSLERLPRRCPLAREAAKAKREIHCLLFGKRRNVYRIPYEVDEAHRTVWVLHIRHGALHDLLTDELARLPGDV